MIQLSPAPLEPSRVQFPSGTMKEILWHTELLNLNYNATKSSSLNRSLEFCLYKECRIDTPLLFLLRNVCAKLVYTDSKF